MSKETKITRTFERTYFDLAILDLGMLYSNAPIRIYPNTNIWYTLLTPLCTTSFHPARPLVSAITVVRKRFERKTFQADAAQNVFLHGVIDASW